MKHNEHKALRGLRKATWALSLCLLASGVFTGCGGAAAQDGVAVISREDGSGTRGAFVELFGVEQKNEAGEKVDHTTDAADITNSTSVMMTSVAGNPAAIGYISLGSLNDTVKALAIDGAAASVENIKNGSYTAARPFNVATTAQTGPAARDFLTFILSREGQAVVEQNGYISAVADAPAYAGKSGADKIVVAGSSSITPVMEKLREAYLSLHPDAQIEVQQSDSTSGMQSLQSGVCDIGMASRALKQSELDAGLVPTVIAMDGIAVIVNAENPLDALTREQVRAIFTGEVTAWSELQS